MLSNRRSGNATPRAPKSRIGAVYCTPDRRAASGDCHPASTVSTVVDVAVAGGGAGGGGGGGGGGGETAGGSSERARGASRLQAGTLSATNSPRGSQRVRIKNEPFPSGNPVSPDIARILAAAPHRSAPPAP